jgi:hypothetical protein
MDTVILSPRDISNADQIEHRAFAHVNTHDHFLGQARRFEFVYHDDVLAIRGHVPSIYLKQILKRVLSEVDGVHQIDYQVTVSPIERDDMVLF